MLGKLDEFLLRFNCRVTRVPGPDVTHVVARADAKRRAETRTIKYLHGLLQRRWVVGPSWLSDSLLKGKIEREVKYELMGDPKASEPSAPLKARLSRYRRMPLLFQKYDVYFWGDFPPPRPTRKDLESLVVVGGGRLVKAWVEGGEGRKCVVICNSVPESGGGREGGMEGGGLPEMLKGEGTVVVSSDWLLDSISNYRVLGYSKFQVLPGKEKTRK